MRNIHVINDCRDENARLRQTTRFGAYFPGANISFAGVSSDVEAAFLLVDTIDALDGNAGVIAVNVAPRNGLAKKHPNGTPFGMIQLGKTTIFASVDGATLRLLNKVVSGLSLCVYDIPEVVPYLTLDKGLQQQIIRTQFRSYEFLPRLARAIVLDGVSLPGCAVSLKSHCGESDLGLVALVDCFGNLKTTLLPEEIGFDTERTVKLSVGGYGICSLRCYLRLKDIPDGELGLTIGSSGLSSNRFLEIMCQGGNASQCLNAKVGTVICLAK